MSIRLAFGMILALAGATAQHRAAAPASIPPRANQGHIPAAPAGRAPATMPEVERSPAGHINSTPHVRNDRWYGHDSPNDTRMRCSDPSSMDVLQMSVLCTDMLWCASTPACTAYGCLVDFILMLPPGTGLFASTGAGRVAMTSSSTSILTTPAGT